MMSPSQPDLGAVSGQASLLSLHGSGVAGGPPSHLSAGAHAIAGPLLVEEVQSLHALSSRTSIGAMTPPPDYDTVYRILTERERDLELAARIGRSLLQRNELLEAELGSQLDTRQQLEQQLAQLRHALGQKEGLLRLYAQDANEASNEGAGEGEGSQGEWIRALTAECQDLRESNIQLTAEADRLQRATTEVEQKERRLVTQCLEQFSEARGRLAELRIHEEQTSVTNQQLRAQLEELEAVYGEEVLSRQQLEAESESLREQLAEAHESSAQLNSHMTEMQDKWEECSVLLKETQDELQALKDASIRSSPPTQDGEQSTAATDHESIVQEIEEALRKEIIAASTLPERPLSPKQYALQRTQAVMATVRAATQAMARRQERLTGQTNTDPPVKNSLLNPPAISTPMHLFNPLATSSPEGPTARLSVGVGVGGLDQSHLAPHHLSPTVSEAGSTLSLPDEASWLRHQHYVSPEKLQIVKPLEGSVTLLKWKLMASPQLGGATSFFSDAARPGVHVKGWKAAGIVDDKQKGTDGLSPELRLKSLSTSDLSYLATSSSSSPSHPHTPSSSHRHRRGGPRRGRGSGIHGRLSSLTTSMSAVEGNGMNTLHKLSRSHDQGAVSHDQGAVSHDDSTQKEGRGEEGKGKETGNTSLLQQVGSLFGWSRVGLGGRGARNTEEIQPGAEGRDTEEVDSPSVASGDMGLAGIL